MTAKLVWFIGGAFLNTTIDYLQVLRSLYDENREKAPLFDKYDFEHFTSNHKNPLVRMNEAFFKAINNKGYLPALIIYIMDDDIFSEPELYLPSEIELHLRWIFSVFDETLKSRKREMPKRAFLQGQPQSYIFKALPRFDDGNDPNYLVYEDRVAKYNSLLQAIGRCFSIGTINIQDITPHDYRSFKQNDGKSLSTYGHYRLWREALTTIHEITHDLERDQRKRILQDEVGRRETDRNRRRDNPRF